MNVLVFSSSISFFFISFLDFISRIAVIWISSPELSYVCHTYAMPIMCSYVGRKFVINILISCIVETVQMRSHNTCIYIFMQN